MNTNELYTAFAGTERVAQGDRAQVALAVKILAEAKEPRAVLVFADPTGEQVDLDLRGSVDDVSARHAATSTESPGADPARRPPGRPRLGVVGREVTLLPRHWEWLNAQPGGASVTLRKLVEQARSGKRDQDRIRRSREAAYRFMSAIAGNEPGFEDACRALFAGDRKSYAARTRDWPVDVRDYARMLATEAFDPG
ncbi:DUF2239 family protein [bacterium]|nr:DUF2239 family protein [bacterium]MBU1676263.1 DUF2239 family protein [bacterium]